MIAGVLAAARRRTVAPAGPMVTNGNFDADLVGWTPTVSGSAQWVASGSMRVKDLGSYAGVQQALSLVPGSPRSISFECVAFAGVFFQVGIGRSFGDTAFFVQNVFAAGSFGPASFTVDSSNPVLWIRSLGGGNADTADFDAVSVV